jgi:PTS system fructose-specific IIC component
MEPFTGKIFHKTDTDAVIKNPQAVLQDTMNYCAMVRKQRALGTEITKGSKRKRIISAGQEDFIQSAGKGKPMVLKHILSGCSYLIPFVVFAGLTFSIITGISKLYFGPNFNFPSTVEGIREAIKTGTLANNG